MILAGTQFRGNAHAPINFNFARAGAPHPHPPMKSSIGLLIDVQIAHTNSAISVHDVRIDVSTKSV